MFLPTIPGLKVEEYSFSHKEAVLWTINNRKIMNLRDGQHKYFFINNFKFLKNKW